MAGAHVAEGLRLANEYSAGMSSPRPTATARPTIGHVARRAGVSTATVSRVLNQPETVREGLRAKVETAVAASDGSAK